MSRLYEEVRTRLEEMAMIASRTLDLNAGRQSEVKFCSLTSGAEVELEAVELVCTPQRRACYDYRQGACFEIEEAGSEACLAREGKTA